VLFFQASGDIGSFNANGVYDLTRYGWLTQDTQSGRFLAGIFGWDPRPSIEQVVAYLVYVVPVLVLFFRRPRTGRAATRPPVSTGAVHAA
jgi:high-affinity iron transporter